MTSSTSFFDAVRRKAGLHVVAELDRTLSDFRRNTALAVLEEILDDDGHLFHDVLEEIVEANWPGGAA